MSRLLQLTALRELEYAHLPAIWGVNIRRASDWRECLFRTVGEGLLYRALSRSAEALEACQTKSAEDSGRYNESRPFLLAKLCLIPPFSP